MRAVRQLDIIFWYDITVRAAKASRGVPVRKCHDMKNVVEYIEITTFDFDLLEKV